MESYTPAEVPEELMVSFMTDMIFAFPKPAYDDPYYEKTIWMLANDIARDERYRYNVQQIAIDKEINAEAVAFATQFKMCANAEEPAPKIRQFFKSEHENRDLHFDEKEYAAKMFEVFRLRMDELYQHGYYFEEIIGADGEMTSVVKPLSTPVRR